MRRPLDEPVTITGDRASHAVYGVGPATDYACPVGTPVYAPFGGDVSSYVTTEGGLGIIVDGAKAAFYGQHLWVRLAAGRYAAGDRIALTGNSGALTTGPHLHCYVIIHSTGERLSMEEYLTRAASNDARPFDPAPSSPEEDTMATKTPLRIGYFSGVPGSPVDTICVANVDNHTFYRVGTKEQAAMVNGPTGENAPEQLFGVQPFDPMLVGFREI